MPRGDFRRPLLTDTQSLLFPFQGEEILSQASQASEMEEEEEVSMITREEPVEVYKYLLNFAFG